MSLLASSARGEMPALSCAAAPREAKLNNRQINALGSRYIPDIGHPGVSPMGISRLLLPLGLRQSVKVTVVRFKQPLRTTVSLVVETGITSQGFLVRQVEFREYELKAI
jgi:hypothetical protein